MIKPVANYIPHEAIWIESDSDFELYNFSGDGTENNPYIIENYYISSEHYDNGIKIKDTSKYFIIKNCYFNETKGVNIEDVADETMVIRNNIFNSGGIKVYYTSYGFIENNYYDTLAAQSEFYIEIHDSTYLSVINNTCGFGFSGMLIDSSNNLLIQNNTFVNTNYSGMHLRYVQDSHIDNNLCKNNSNSGILLYKCSFNTLTNNTCLLNKYGIFCGPDYYLKSNSYSSMKSDRFLDDLRTNNTLIENHLENNTSFGVFLGSLYSNSLLYHNYFIDNNLEGTSQGCDNGTNNLWYNAELLEGNFWNDWTGTGGYHIEGSANAIDYYPLWDGFFGSFSSHNANNASLLLLFVFCPIIILVKRLSRRKGSLKKN
ncbi:MAG: right-handed parallel beta-helix repeat-containing protein [Asgard group archaeon]|nr:right-handed parallel beta-helix repeat-containing protein [Asgard group archaeon]